MRLAPLTALFFFFFLVFKDYTKLTAVSACTLSQHFLFAFASGRFTHFICCCLIAVLKRVVAGERY